MEKQITHLNDFAAVVPAEPLRGSVAGVVEHPLRFGLNNELHARPYELLAAPVQASHLALMHDGDAILEERRLIVQLCERYGVNPPAESANHYSEQLGSFRFKWERHTEFSTYTFFHAAPFDTPFAVPAISQVPSEWLQQLPGQVVVATHLAIEDRRAPQRELEDLGLLFAGNTVIGSRLAAGAAAVWTDYRIHADGFGRILVRDINLRRRQAGRVAQRLLEIETYRTLAVLSLPLIRRYTPQLAVLEERLAMLTGKTIELDGVEDERHLLQELSGLAAEVENLSAATNYRFGASLAYHQLVQSRIAELRERRIHGLQTIQEFMERRLTPATDTCAAVRNRKVALSTGVSRASDLLRTRVEIATEEQTRDLLRSMDRRSHMQVRLQETVEGLSVVVLTYYSVGLLSYALKAVKASGVKVDIEVTTGLAIPLVMGLIFLGVRYLRTRVNREDERPVLRKRFRRIRRSRLGRSMVQGA